MFKAHFQELGHTHARTKSLRWHLRRHSASVAPAPLVVRVVALLLVAHLRRPSELPTAAAAALAPPPLVVGPALRREVALPVSTATFPVSAGSLVVAVSAAALAVSTVSAPETFAVAALAVPLIHTRRKNERV